MFIYCNLYSSGQVANGNEKDMKVGIENDPKVLMQDSQISSFISAGCFFKKKSFINFSFT